MSRNIPFIKFDSSLIRCPDNKGTPYLPRFRSRNFNPDTVKWEFVKLRSSFQESYKFRSNTIISFIEKGEKIQIDRGFSTTKKNPYFFIERMREGEMVFVELKLTATESSSGKKAVAFNEVMIFKGDPIFLPVMIKTVSNGRLVSSYVYEEEPLDLMFLYNRPRTWNNEWYKEKKPEALPGVEKISLETFTKHNKLLHGFDYVEDVDTLNQNNIPYYDLGDESMQNLTDGEKEHVHSCNRIRENLSAAALMFPRHKVKVMQAERLYGIASTSHYTEGRSSHSAKTKSNSAKSIKKSTQVAKKYLGNTLNIINSILGIYPSCDITCTTETKQTGQKSSSREMPNGSCNIAKLSITHTKYTTKDCCDKDAEDCSDEA